MCLELPTINQNNLSRQSAYIPRAIFGEREEEPEGWLRWGSSGEWGDRLRQGPDDGPCEGHGPGGGQWGHRELSPRSTSNPGPSLYLISADCLFIPWKVQEKGSEPSHGPTATWPKNAKSSHPSDQEMISVHPALPPNSPAFVTSWHPFRHWELRWPQMQMLGWGNS